MARNETESQKNIRDSLLAKAGIPVEEVEEDELPTEDIIPKDTAVEKSLQRETAIIDPEEAARLQRQDEEKNWERIRQNLLDLAAEKRVCLANGLPTTDVDRRIGNIVTAVKKYINDYLPEPESRSPDEIKKAESLQRIIDYGTQDLFDIED